MNIKSGESTTSVEKYQAIMGGVKDNLFITPLVESIWYSEDIQADDSMPLVRIYVIDFIFL